MTVEEEGGVHLSIRISRTAVMLLYGRTVSDDDLLKVFQTALEGACEICSRRIARSLFSTSHPHVIVCSRYSEAGK